SPQSHRDAESRRLNIFSASLWLNMESYDYCSNGIKHHVGNSFACVWIFAGGVDQSLALAFDLGSHLAGGTLAEVSLVFIGRFVHHADRRHLWRLERIHNHLDVDRGAGRLAWLGLVRFRATPQLCCAHG